MTREEVYQFAEVEIRQVLAGAPVENDKLDFKRKWYDLTNENDINEFIRDCCAIVNSFGPDGYLIIGLDEKSKEWYESKFSDCKLRDTSHLIGLIHKKVDRMFPVNVYDYSFDGHPFSVIHIPPSIDKPHVMRSFIMEKEGRRVQDDNRVFLRKGSTTAKAGRHDLDLMYYDRKNIIPEHSLLSFATARRFYHRHVDRNNGWFFVEMWFNLTIENNGSRPLSIHDINLTISFDDRSDNIRFKSSEGHHVKQFVVRSNSVDSLPVKFESENIAVASDINRRFHSEADRKTWQRNINIRYSLHTGDSYNSILKLVED